MSKKSLKIINNMTETIYVYNLTKNVLNKHIKEWTKCDIEDYDLDRIYLNIDNEEYTIRTWNIISNSKNTVKIEYTLFHCPRELDHGIRKGGGTVTTKFN